MITLKWPAERGSVPADPRSAVAIARGNYQAALHLEYPDELLPSARWARWSKLAADAIATFETPQDATWFAQHKIGFEHRYGASESIGRWDAYEAAVLSDFPEQAALFRSLAESPLSHPESVAFFAGRSMSSMMFWHAYEFLAVFDRVPHAQRVLEIGGGYGAVARLWLTHSPALSSYWIIDFPESLFFAEAYLRGNFPDLRVHYVTEGQTLDEIEQAQADIVLCPAQLAGNLRGAAADVVINCDSMQEMTEDAVIYWSEWIEAADLSYFYSLNYFLQPLTQVRGGSANWLCPRLGPDWECLVARLDPTIVRLQSWRHFRELLYRRVPPWLASSEQQHLLAAEILAANSGPSSIPREAGVLELFEALRLSCSPAVIERLIEILSSFYDYRPKELVYLCKLGMASPDVSSSDRKWYGSLLDELMLTAKQEHTVIPTNPLF